MSKNKEATHFTYSILGDSWGIYKVPDHDNTIMEEGAEAETDLDNREIYFKACSLDSVIHEISHIYFRSTYTRFTSISVADMEEICVALIADRGELIFKQAKEILTKLKELQ